MSIRAMRERAGMSRYALAKATGMSYQGLFMIEHEDRTPRLETLHKVSEVLAKKLGVGSAQVLAELTAPSTGEAVEASA